MNARKSAFDVSMMDVDDQGTLLIPPMGLMSALLQSYLVRYPRRLGMKCRKQNRQTLHQHWLIQEQEESQTDLEPRAAAGPADMRTPCACVLECSAVQDSQHCFRREPFNQKRQQ
jgi:hypothetical protein